MLPDVVHRETSLNKLSTPFLHIYHFSLYSSLRSDIGFFPPHRQHINTKSVKRQSFIRLANLVQVQTGKTVLDLNLNPEHVLGLDGQ